MFSIWRDMRIHERHGSMTAVCSGLRETSSNESRFDAANFGNRCHRGSAPDPGIFFRHGLASKWLGSRIDGCDLARNCGLWYCQTAGQNLQVMFNRHQWLKKNRPACSVAGPPNHAGLKRHSDASARVSLTGCVPAEPASVFPRSARMPQLQHSVTTA